MIKVVIGKAAKGEELKWEGISHDELVSLASTPALFGGEKTFVLVGATEALDDLLEAFDESPHTFILEEEKLLKAPRQRLEKLKVKIEEAKIEKKEFVFDEFGLTAALGKRDKKGLWLGLAQALAAGQSAEALAGLLAWKARQIRDVSLSRKITFMYHDSHRGAGDLELLLERFALTL